MNEHQRHVKARQDIMSGKTPEKRIFVHMEDLEEKKKREDEIKADRERRNGRMDALKETKTPWFCPNCPLLLVPHAHSSLVYTLASNVYPVPT